MIEKPFQQDSEQLRSAAELKLLSAQSSIEPSRSAEALLHELQVHQIELEMQNENLRKAHIEMEASRDCYVDLYDFSPVGYLTLSSTGLISEVNLTAADLLGITRSKLIKRRFANFVVQEDIDRWHQYFLRAHQSDEKSDCELSFKCADGIRLDVHLNALRLEDGMGGYAVRITLTDIIERKRMVAELCLLREIKEKRAAELVNKELTIAATIFESQEGMMVTDANNVILRVNYAFTNITGYSAEEAVGQTPALLSSGMQGKEFYDTMWESLKRSGYWEGEIWNKRKNGELYPEYLCITAVKDKDGVLTNYVATLTDITMSRDAADKIQHLAFYDTLTNLPNRRLLLERLKLAQASSTRSGKYGAILFIDLDNFKVINDTKGHDVGDLLLQSVAQRLESCVREGDTVARLGGDEFVIIINELSGRDLDAAAQAVAVGKKILNELNMPYQLASYEYRSTSSIGANLFSGHEINIEELLKQSDIAMYQAKKDGRNTLRFFDPAMQESIIERARMEAELQAALEYRQFQLFYQIQVDSSGHALGAEALIRWNHPERGLVSPMQFIPLAEETGQILLIGHWVLDTACAQLARWQKIDTTRHLTLSVNVSARQFHQIDFVAQVRQVLLHHEINPAKLKLEPTESVLLDNIEEAVATMNELRGLGVQFALDDFGTGFSSLQYLKRLPLNQLKIDQSFVRDLVSGENDQAIVRTIIAMAHGLNLEVIAEGVETAEQQKILQENGCQHFQGYLFGKPIPIEQFERTLMRE